MTNDNAVSYACVCFFPMAPNRVRMTYVLGLKRIYFRDSQLSCFTDTMIPGLDCDHTGSSRLLFFLVCMESDKSPQDLALCQLYYGYFKSVHGYRQIIFFSPHIPGSSAVSGLQ